MFSVYNNDQPLFSLALKRKILILSLYHLSRKKALNLVILYFTVFFNYFKCIFNPFDKHKISLSHPSTEL